MNNQVSSVVTSSVPHIVVTEPSPISVQPQDAVSVIRRIESVPEVTANGATVSSESVKVSLEQAAETSIPAPTSSSSGEFIPAQECHECVVPVPEQSASQSVEDTLTTATTEPEQDNFRTPDVGCCGISGIQYVEYYEKMWNAMHSGYALPFWLLLLTLPLSAGVMGALYMYSCPASHSLTTLIFIIGISLMAVISLRVCLIIRRMTTSEEDDWRSMLHTLLLISTFLTVLFFVTESVAFWRMTQTSHPGAPEYCDPHFLTYSFWWNCVMCVVMVPLFLFPA